MPLFRSERLLILPFTPELIRAALRDPTEVGHALGARVPAGWPNADEVEMLPAAADAAERDPDRIDWGPHLFVREEERTLVGGAGWMGPPDPTGAAAIGYGIVPAQQRRGYATEGAGALVRWALAQPTVHRVVAGCEADNAASIRVLEKLGFRQLPAAGTLLSWELLRS